MNEKLFMAITTYGELMQTGKYNNYDIIEKFIIYVISADSLFEITEVNVSDSLKLHFGFVNLPRAIVSRVLNLMLEKGLLECIGEKSNRHFKTSNIFNELIVNNKEIDAYDSIVNSNLTLIKNSLFKWYSEKLERDLNDDDKKNVLNMYYEFISNAMSNNESNLLISNFVISCSDSINELIQQNINSYIIFQGINYEISDLDLNLKNEIKLIFDMEVLFDLVGYNGDYYRIRAEEMMHYISEINNKRNGTIKLFYFKDTKDYISQFFDTASKIKYGNSIFDYNINTAMEYIFNNTKNPSDVHLLKNNLFSTLKIRFGISEDNTNYYSSEFNKFTLSTDFYSNDTYATLNPNGNKDSKISEGINYFDAIIKLREEVVCKDFFNSKAIFVTETSLFRDMSKLLTKEGGIFENNYRLCVDMNCITNILWLKLGKGLGNINVVNSNKVMMLAKMIIAKNNNRNLNEICRINREKFESGEITKEAFKNTIAEARSHKDDILPDNINNKNYDITYESICDLTASKQHEALEKKKLNDTIINLTNKVKDYNTISEELSYYKNIEKRENEKKENFKKFKCKIFKMVFICLVFLIFMCLTIYLYCKTSVFNYISGIASMISLAYLIYTIFKK